MNLIVIVKVYILCSLHGFISPPPPLIIIMLQQVVVGQLEQPYLDELVFYKF